MPSLVATFAVTISALLASMLMLWLISLLRQDASVADPFWGLGFVLIAGIAMMRHFPPGPRGMLLVVLIMLWGLRLSIFLTWRNWNHREDHRYRVMREFYGPRFWWISLFTVFVLQGMILWFVSWPIQAALATNSMEAWSWLDAFGVGLWALGLVFETVGDCQLARFKADPANAGRVLDRGLWRLTRHPNYFGDFCVWWGLYLIAASGGAAWTILSPLLMSFLLLKVSGVTLLESTITDRRPDYATYQRRTNAFFPGPPRN